MEPGVPLPRRIQLQRRAETLELRWRWRKTQHLLPLLLAYLTCCGPLPAWRSGQSLIDGTTHQDRPGELVRIPWLGYTLKGLAVAGVVLFVLHLLVSTDRSILRARLGQVIVRHRPFPLRAQVELRAQDILRFEARPTQAVRKSRATAKRRPPVDRQDEPWEPVSGGYALYAIDHHVRPHLLVSELDAPEQCEGLERELRRAMGMPVQEDENS